jgi:hypothetical protein
MAIALQLFIMCKPMPCIWWLKLYSPFTCYAFFMCLVRPYLNRISSIGSYYCVLDFFMCFVVFEKFYNAFNNNSNELLIQNHCFRKCCVLSSSSPSQLFLNPKNWKKYHTPFSLLWRNQNSGSCFQQVLILPCNLQCIPTIHFLQGPIRICSPWILLRYLTTTTMNL